MGLASYKQSHDYCRAIFRERKPSLFFLSYLLFRAERKAFYSLFTYANFVAGGFLSGDIHTQHIKSCEDLLERIYGHDRTKFVFQFELALEQTVSRYEVPQTLLMEILEGYLMNFHHRQPQDEGELADLSAHIGGVWGRCAGIILGRSNEDIEFAGSVGCALWLSERAASWEKDVTKGRFYFPSTWAGEMAHENLQGEFNSLVTGYLNVQMKRLKNDDGRLDGLLKIALETALGMLKKLDGPPLTLYDKVRLVPQLIKVFA